MAIVYKALMLQLQEAEKEVLENIKSIASKNTEEMIESYEEVLNEQQELTKYVESIIKAIEETKQKEETFMKGLEEKYKRKFSVTDLLEIINENDKTNTRS